jgi:hypothetical protein
MQVSSDDADDTMWSTWTGAAAAMGAVQAICGFDCYVCRRPKAGRVDKQPCVPVYVNQCLVSGILQEPLLFESRLMGDALIETRGSCSGTGFLLIVDMMSSQAAGDGSQVGFLRYDRTFSTGMLCTSCIANSRAKLQVG